MPNMTPGNLWDPTNYESVLRSQGFKQEFHYYPNMKLVRSIKLCTAVQVGHPNNRKYETIAFIYSYPVADKTVRNTVISYEKQGAQYYDDDIEEKLGGEKITLGQ